MHNRQGVMMQVAGVPLAPQRSKNSDDYPGGSAGGPASSRRLRLVLTALAGLLAGWLARQGGAGAESWWLLLGVGVLGGYTTFSAFSLEFAQFVQRGALGLAAAYVAVSLVAGFAALFGGLLMMRGLA